LNTPLRRLEGISYWVIEDSEAIYDFINTEIRTEWEIDARNQNQASEDNQWLGTLSNQRWQLDVMKLTQIKLNPEILNYVDQKTNYVFSKSLQRRSSELQQSIERRGVVLSPLIVKREDYQLLDGYCSYTTLNAMTIPKTYAYIGGL